MVMIFIVFISDGLRKYSLWFCVPHLVKLFCFKMGIHYFCSKAKTNI